MCVLGDQEELRMQERVCGQYVCVLRDLEKVQERVCGHKGDGGNGRR